ncbi:MAG: manganese-dependent inorganic pyrophosphatase [Paraclostridium sp.]
MTLLVFGHKNPDTDSICSSVSLAYLKNKLGQPAKAYALGEVRKEAQYVLDYFKVDYPTVLTSLSNICNEDKDLVLEGKPQVILVDHNEYGQSIDGLENANLVEVVDHHKLGGMTTDTPLSMRLMPVGCTCTIITQMYKENNVEIPYEIAGLLMSAILSDTLLFKSPTTTQMDKLAVEELNKIVNVDVDKYAMDMFKAGTSLDGYTVEEIVHMDFKPFDMSGKNVGIGQVFTLDIDAVLNKQDEFLNYINSTEFDMLVLAITDIIKEGSYLIYKGEDQLISDAFGVHASQGVFVEGAVSRKKQLVPSLTEAVKKSI